MGTSNDNDLDYQDIRRRESWSNVQLSSTSDLPKAVEQKAGEEPVTIGEVHQVSEEKGVEVSRSTVKNLMNDMASSGKLKAKRPRKKASKIFWRSDK